MRLQLARPFLKGKIMDRGLTALIQGLCGATAASALPALVPAGRASVAGPLAIRPNAGMIGGLCIGGAPCFRRFYSRLWPRPERQLNDITGCEADFKRAHLVHDA